MVLSFEMAGKAQVPQKSIQLIPIHADVKFYTRLIFQTEDQVSTFNPILLPHISKTVSEYSWVNNLTISTVKWFVFFLKFLSTAIK